MFFVSPFFLQDYTPTGFDKVMTVLEVNKHNVEFVLWDTSGKLINITDDLR